jgi:hypothetical protein
MEEDKSKKFHPSGKNLFLHKKIGSGENSLIFSVKAYCTQIEAAHAGRMQ